MVHFKTIARLILQFPKNNISSLYCRLVNVVGEDSNTAPISPMFSDFLISLFKPLVTKTLSRGDRWSTYSIPVSIQFLFIFFGSQEFGS